MSVVLSVLAAVFVFVCGANDGGALLALALRHRAVAGIAMLGLLLAAIVAGPRLFGLDVAHAFTGRLVASGDRGGQPIVVIGVAAAVALVLVLTWRGVPTSVTLAIIGGLAGAGLGLGLMPSWSTLATMLGIGAAAPLVGGLLGYLLGVLAQRVPTTGRASATVRLAHVGAFGCQCLAYAANDGQKMFAVAAVAVAAVHGSAELSLPVLSAVAALFAAGALTSLRRMSRGATFSLSPPRPWQIVSAEIASSAAVFGTAGLGVPVSMTQSVAAGLVGVGASQGARRVRWQYAVPILISWLVTLPASFGMAAVAGLAVRGLR
ncbi:inorganic phosphate transporter [Micromonospora sp. RTGN7]|uniref:inorganic phosphate transporter n=1 Tax=Micromonospora sp. RTGN7 TaxID=3016526 RepID=UPI0029FF1859|nr:inorganic phosphate transporter [Micromonospora sp. RTGN7]